MVTEANDALLNRLFDGRYLVLRKLGSGGMAEVYLAEDQELGRKVALKMLNERHARDDQFVERFKREARNAAGLNHPHIVRVYDRGQAEGTYYIAMEYLDGRTLKELLVEKGPTPPKTAVKFAREILSALAEAHRHEIVHRDIKPHNVIVSPSWQLKVTDFGIARSGASQMTEVGSIVGTAQYLSPEQARGAPVDQRSDLYSLGIVLYEMLTGRVPFSGDAAVEIAMKHLSAVPDPPSKLRPDVPPELDAVVMRALAKDPDQRYSSAQEMDADLARVARGEAPSSQTTETMTQVIGATTSLAAAPTIAQSPPPAVPIPPAYRPVRALPDGPPPRRRSPWPTLLGLLALAILAAGGYLLYTHVVPTLRGNGKVAVLDVRDTPLQGAEINLTQQGLHSTAVKAASTTIPQNNVITQSPLPGTVVKKGSTVTLTVSTGIPTIGVPKLIGDGVSQAETLLHAAGLHAKLFHHYGSEPVGSVTSETPGAGVTVPVGSKVTIAVSVGPKNVSVPDVYGEPYADAASALEGAHFTPVKVTAPSSSAPAGQVIGQSPSGGELEPPYSKVQLTVSSGPRMVALTNVDGDLEADAEQILTQEGFTPRAITQPVTDPTQNGLVLAENPAGGTQPTGSIVTITVGALVTPTTPTTPTPTSTSSTSSTTTGTTATTASTPTTTNSATTTVPAATTTAATTTTQTTSPATTATTTTTAQTSTTGTSTGTTQTATTATTATTQTSTTDTATGTTATTTATTTAAPPPPPVTPPP